MSQGQLTVGDVRWVLENLLTLREGLKPDGTRGEITLPISSSGVMTQADFVIHCGIAAEVEIRLSMCGLDGFLVKQVYAWGESYEYLSRNLYISGKKIERGIEAALAFITGWWPKEYNYYLNKAHISEVTRHKKDLSGEKT